MGGKLKNLSVFSFPSEKKEKKTSLFNSAASADNVEKVSQIACKKYIQIHINVAVKKVIVSYRKG